MAKHKEDWIPFHGWDSRDWGQAGIVAGAIVAGALTGGIGAGAAAGGLGVAAGAGIGAGVGALVGGSTAYQDQLAEETEEKTKRAVARQEAKAVENEILRKSSLLAAQNTMTAREAMARNVNAAIRNMYRPKTASNNPTPYTLGGDDEVLG